MTVVLLASRPQYLGASVAPVLVGSALGYGVAGSFSFGLFLLAVLSIMALHAGANVINDYFDHLSRNDWVNQNPTPFSGGRQFIQKGILSPKATLLAGLFYLAIGSGIGLVIVALTQSPVILGIGILGVLGGFFYTARPIQLGYRGVGEVMIGLLFGVLPVYGSYYLQAQTIDVLPLLPALIVAILIFLVILINEFPDLPADRQVHKRTMVVVFGIPVCVLIYRATLIASYIVAAAMLAYNATFFAGVFYLLTLPLAVFAMRSANPADLAKPGLYRANQLTILLHNVGSLTLAGGLLIPGLVA
ncbi:MAG: 1,4-dihydroxy-2-naphthoate octaprenyltransferase [Planctomycetes bacterium RBG_13_60_9]|nr:MAG: 1,4-dihydroxy-2-naphthoate octaprenyltransferase [Planctomycetes bacterium RBG_13_60_9]